MARRIRSPLLRFNGAVLTAVKMPHGCSLYHSNQLILINFVAVLAPREKLSPFFSHLSECYWHLGEDLTDRLTFHKVIVARCQQRWWKEHRWHENQTNVYYGPNRLQIQVNTTCKSSEGTRLKGKGHCYRKKVLFFMKNQHLMRWKFWE